MSTTGPDPRPDVDVVALVDADITRAVQESATRTASPYFGSADLAVNLGGLRRHVGDLAVQRPDLLDTLAAHYNVPGTAFHVLNAVDADAHDRLHHRYEAGGAYPTPSVLNTAHPAPSTAPPSTPPASTLTASTRTLGVSPRAPAWRTAPHRRSPPTRAGG